MPFPIGSTTWFRGDELTVTSEPYMAHGGEFQDAIRADGKTFAVATPEQREHNAREAQREHREQQEQFRRLNRR